MGRVRQERFLLTPDTDTKEEEPEYTWRVPLSFTSPGHGFEVTSPSACLDPATANVSSVIDLCEVVSSPEEPVILNVQQTAFYRVCLYNFLSLPAILIRNHKVGIKV